MTTVSADCRFRPRPAARIDSRKMNGAGAASVPAALNYQGRLQPDQGVLAAGPYGLQFRFWSAATGGTQLWARAFLPVYVLIAYSALSPRSLLASVTRNIILRLVNRPRLRLIDLSQAPVMRTNSAREGQALGGFFSSL